MLVLSPDREKCTHDQKTEEDWKIYKETFLPKMKDLAAMEAIAELRQRSSTV